MVMMSTTSTKRGRTRFSCLRLGWVALVLVVAFQILQICYLEAEIAPSSVALHLLSSLSSFGDRRRVLLRQGSQEQYGQQLAVSSPEDSSLEKCQSWPQQRHATPKGLVVTLAHASDDKDYLQTLQRMVCNAIPSQLTHLLGPQQWDMLLLIAVGDQELLSFANIQQCLNLTLVADEGSATKNWNNLDGSEVTTTEYRWNNRVSVFLGQVELQWPKYIQNNMTILEQKIEPENCNSPKSYIQGTRWYSNEMLHLAILQNYHWVIKMDLDVYFVKTVEWSLLHDLQTRNSLFAHAAELPPDMGLECADNIVHAVKEFTTQKSIGFCDTQHPLLRFSRDHWYTNFIMMRVDFWTQPRVRELGRYLSEYRAGFFKYRWTDQVFWAQAMGMLVPVDDSTVTDYSELRCSPERNCWRASFSLKLYGDDSNQRCDNDAYFVHHKDPSFPWNRTLSHTGDLWQSDVKVHPLAYKDECRERIPRKFKEKKEEGMLNAPQDLAPARLHHPDEQGFKWSTPTCQSWPRQEYESPRGLVVTLILTPDDPGYLHSVKTIVCNSIPSQLTHLLGPQKWDMLLLVAGNHFHDVLSFERMSSCLNLTKVENNPTRVWQNLDGSNLTTTEYRWNDRVSVFLSLAHPQWPQYIQDDMSILEQKIEPANCNAPKSYIQGTRWYSNELLHLAILQEYQWAIKLDLDLYFVRTVEWSLLHDLQTRNSLFGHTAEMPPNLGRSCADNIVHAVKDFTTNQSMGFCDKERKLLRVDRDFWYTNFIMLRVDFWTQPRVRELGRYLSEYREGFFKYRWTDQIFWAQALGMLVPHKGSVTDYSELRCSVERNCWRAVFANDLYGITSYSRCDNNAYFIHHKGEKFKWNRTVTHTGPLWKSNTEVHPLSYKDECSEVLERKRREVQEEKNMQQGGQKAAVTKQLPSPTKQPIRADTQKPSTCQTWPRQLHTNPRGLVVTLILTPDDETYAQTLQKKVCNAIPSQLTHLLGPQQWDMLLLVAGDHFRDRLSFEYISACLNLTLAEHDATKTWHNLDGSALLTTEYRWDDRVSIFLAQTDLQWPLYIQNNMTILEQKIEPENCNSPKSYIQSTRWYSDELLHLTIVQDYHWVIKLDLDVYFVKTVEWNLLHDLQTRNSLFAHTAEMPPEMGRSCADNIVNAVEGFVKKTDDVQYCDTEYPLLNVDRDHWYTNFIMMRVDFWTQPRIRELGRYLSEHRAGFFKYRWTDQVFWAQALGMLVPVNESSVTDYSELRCSPERNCWRAAFFPKLYGGDSIQRCDNDAYFLHQKDADLPWNRTVSYSGKLWQSDNAVHPLSYKDECSERIPRRHKELTEKKELALS